MKQNLMRRINAHLEDLNPILAGVAQCDPGSRITPLRISMMLHYVVSGCGTLHLDGKVYPVRAGQAFVLNAEKKAYYVADAQDPWYYRWICFSGRLAADFSKLLPVFDAPEDTLIHIEDIDCPDPMMAYLLTADLFALYAHVVSPDERSQNHVQKAIDFVEVHYMNKLTIQDVADFVGLNPSYLSKLFKQKTGHTLQSYILDIRLQESKRYLAHGYTVKEAAAACGFQDLANYSKLFKRENGRSPTQWLDWVQDEPKRK